MAIPTFTLNVGGTTYTGAQRAATGIHMGSLELNLEGAYDQLTFTEVGGGPVPLFANAQHVTLTRDSDSLVVFSGEITDTHWAPIPKGWGKAYTCQGLRYIADRVPSTWTDGTGEQVFNREPQDPYYVPSLAGLTVGEIIALALTVPFTATLLDSYGVGNYVSLSPPTLPTVTVNDLALMTAVPAKTVTFSGESLINTIAQFVPSWMPRFVEQITPDGYIRFKDTTDVGAGKTFVPKTMTLPGTAGVGDTGVQWPSISASTRNCSTAVELRGGPETEGAWETVLDGTLVPGWTSGDQSAWTLFDFTQPNDAYDTGTITALTSTSATITSDSGSVHWILNFWNSREGTIFMTDLVAAGISQNETRIVTSCTAMTAGGSATITWDSSWPITGTAYTRYRLVGTAGGLVDVGRLFYFADAATGDFGLNSYIGSRLVVRSATAVRVANNDKTFGDYYGSTATVCNSSSGSPPFVELPAVCEVVPAIGGVRFTQPTQAAFASQATLEAGYPATDADGKPSEIRVLAIYSRGALSARSPSSGFSGTAYTANNLQVVKYADFPDWIWAANTTSFGQLAGEYLAAIQNVVFDGTVTCYEFPAAFDVMTFDWAINFALNGGSSPWTAMNAPIRSVKVDWGNGQEAIHFVTLTFSSLRKPFTAESLYLHPQYAPGSPLTDLTTALSGTLGVGGGTGVGGALLGPGAVGDAMTSMAGGAMGAQRALGSSAGAQMGGMAGQAASGMAALSGNAGAMGGAMGSGSSSFDPSGFMGDVGPGPRYAPRKKRPTMGTDRGLQRAPLGTAGRDEWRQSYKDMGSSFDPNDTNPDPSDQPIRTRALADFVPPERQRKPLFVGPPAIQTQRSPLQRQEMARHRAEMQARRHVPGPAQPPLPRAVHRDVPRLAMPAPETESYGWAPPTPKRRRGVASADQTPSGETEGE